MQKLLTRLLQKDHLPNCNAFGRDSRANQHARRRPIRLLCTLRPLPAPANSATTPKAPSLPETSTLFGSHTEGAAGTDAAAAGNDAAAAPCWTPHGSSHAQEGSCSPHAWSRLHSQTPHGPHARCAACICCYESVCTGWQAAIQRQEKAWLFVKRLQPPFKIPCGWAELCSAIAALLSDLKCTVKP